ncbi:MAG TPA: zinc ribbon domain-containing protein [Actinomycetota bacterium]|nr:zinc ribbon domain-containing protein [Actinomycetota bacterium]
MPIYEFACDGCGHRFEELLARTAADPACPSCGSASVTRLISLFATAGQEGSGGGCACGGRCACGRRS